MSAASNPYQPSNNPDERSVHLLNVPRWSRWLWGVAYMYPIGLFCSFYVAWFIAWMTLGRMPVQSLDDPASIGGLTSAAYFFSGILILAMPILAPLGLAASVFLPYHQSKIQRVAMRCLLAVVYVALCIVVVGVLRADPGGIVEWFFD